MIPREYLLRLTKPVALSVEGRAALEGERAKHPAGSKRYDWLDYVLTETQAEYDAGED